MTTMGSCGACRDGKLSTPISMAFQPVVDIKERRIDAYEALVRGPNGEDARHVLSQITSENRYAFDQACRVKAIEMASALGIQCSLNINCLPNAVYEPAACIAKTLATAARTGFRLNRMTFEIVEQEDLADIDHLQRIVHEYRQIGFKIAMDDFGSGFSSLARFADLKPDTVKLDRAVVQNCDTDETRRAIIIHTVRLCLELNVKLLVEGVDRSRSRCPADGGRAIHAGVLFCAAGLRSGGFCGVYPLVALRRGGAAGKGGPLHRAEPGEGVRYRGRILGMRKQSLHEAETGGI